MAVTDIEEEQGGEQADNMKRKKQMVSEGAFKTLWSAI